MQEFTSRVKNKIQDIFQTMYFRKAYYRQFMEYNLIFIQHTYNGSQVITI